MFIFQFKKKYFSSCYVANLIIMIFYVEKAFNAFSCKMCGKYIKNESEIMENVSNHVFFLGFSCRF